jgi:hypothetical protein
MGACTSNAPQQSRGPVYQALTGCALTREWRRWNATASVLCYVETRAGDAILHG